VVEVAEALHWFSDQWIFWGHWPEVFGTAADSAQKLGDPLVEATQLNYHAWAVLLCEGRPYDSLSLSARALEAARRADDPDQQAWAHNYTAWAHRLLGDYASALDANDQAARLFEAADDLHGALQSMNGHGNILLEAGRAEEALASDLRTLAFLDEAGDRVEPHIALAGRLNLHVGVGRAYAHMERWEEAITSLQTAVGLSVDSRNTGFLSRCLVRLGTALLSAGRTAEAREAFSRCISLGSDADPQRVAEARDHLARLDAD
jgi:tetratricopeptide (TPR) repeat protein